MITRQSYGRSNISAPTTAKKYMEIPISADVFELPLLAFKDFVKIHQQRKESNMIVAQLYSCGQTSTYKSMDSIMKDVLSTYFDRHLSKIEIVGTNNIYYATFGAVFDENFTSLMMLSWIMERRVNEEGVIKYRYKKPLLRLNPYPCLNKEDALQKFICGRWMTTALGTRVHTPSAYYCRDFIEQSGYLSFNHVKIEIDECPFVIRGTEVPSISVTNEGLLQLAAEHIDEILQ
jgi:hypothetical protein